ncbi:MAG: hypothetical protein RR245_03245 [Clostridia bacterium]
MKKSLTILLLLVSIMFVFAGCNTKPVYEKELVLNGTFEDVVNNLDYWYSGLDVKNNSDGKTQRAYHSEGSNATYGKQFLKLQNTSSSGNFSYVYQEVSVVKRGTYKVSALIKNESLSQGKHDTFTGGGITILEGDVLLTSVNTIGDWTEYTIYVKPKNTKTITVALSLGASDSYSVGKTCFDNVSVKRVKSVPAGAEVKTIFKPHEKAYELSSVGGIMFIVLLSVLTVGIMVGAYFFYRKLLMDGSKKALVKNTAITVSLLVLLGLAIRFILASTLFARGSTSYLVALAKDFDNLGWMNVYTKYSSFAPLYIYSMTATGGIVRNMSSLAGMSVVIRLLAILCEGATIALLYFFSKKYTSEKIAGLIAGLYAILPITFVLSGGYSNIVPVLSFLLLVMFISIIEKKYIVLMAAALIGVLWSPVVIYVLPFVIMYEVVALIKANDKKLYVKFIAGFVVSFVLFIMLSSFAVKNQFYVHGHVFYIFLRYSNMMFASQACVANAFNLYGLFGLNGLAVNKTAFWLNLVFSLILVVYTMSLYFKNKNRGELMLMVAFFLTTISVFSLNMNDTSLAVGLGLLLAYIAISGELRLFWVFGWFVLLSFVNVGVVMNMSGALGETMKLTYFAKDSVLYAFGNVIASLTTIYYGYVVYDITSNSKRVSIMPMPAKEKSVNV